MPLTLVQLSSGFPGWNVGMEHLFNDSERLGKEHKCSRNGSNINFCLLVSICCSSGNDAWAGLCLLDTGVMVPDEFVWCCSPPCAEVFHCSLCRTAERDLNKAQATPSAAWSSSAQMSCARDGRNPHSGGVNPCGSRTNSTGCWRVAVLELGKCHSPGRHRGDSTGLELGQAAGDTASSNISSAAASSSWCSLEKNRG